MGTITYTPQAEDYIAAAKLEMRLQFRKNWLGSLFAVVFFGGLGAAMALDPPRGKGAAQGLGMIGICAFAFGVVALRYYVLVPRNIRKGFRLRPQKPVRIEWDETRLVSEDEVVKVTGPWPEFTNWLEDQQVFILFFRGRRFQVIPKRALADPAAVLSLHDMFSCKIGAPGVLRK